LGGEHHDQPEHITVSTAHEHTTATVDQSQPHEVPVVSVEPEPAPVTAHRPTESPVRSSLTGDLNRWFAHSKRTESALADGRTAFDHEVEQWRAANSGTPLSDDAVAALRTRFEKSLKEAATTVFPHRDDAPNAAVSRSVNRAWTQRLSDHL